MTAAAETTFETLLTFVKQNRGFDFTGYKRSSLERRIARRMQAVQCAGYADYQDFLEVHPDEFEVLFNTILINVTAFFRDAPTWDHLRGEVLPAMLATRRDDAPIRVWSAGCASGEEAYSMAMVLADLLGDRGYKARVKIYATDVDEDALQIARAASYTAKQAEVVPHDALDRYFERSGRRYVFRDDLRRTVIFGRNDLVHDAPISHIDLLLCRNTLMYFNEETQSRVVRRFHFGLDPAGLLVLGKSDMLVTQRDLFVPTDLKRRVFRKAAGAAPAEPVAPAAGSPARDAGAGGDGSALRDSALEAGPVAQVIVDGRGTIVSVNQPARAMFGLNGQIVGRLLQDLDLSYRPVELRSHLDRQRADGRPARLRTVPWDGIDGNARVLDVQLTPLRDGDGIEGTSVSYVDVTHAQRVQDELDRARHDLDQAYEQLQSSVEELETTNEELRSTNEELETTNEELQSTNEELETMNEELRSANEKLHTTNAALRARSLELDEANALHQTILATMGVGLAVLDAHQMVRVWNGPAEELWGVRSEDAVGRHVLSLETGLPAGDVRAGIRAALEGEGGGEIVVDSGNGGGGALRCRVRSLPLAATGRGVTGVILLMEPTASGSG
jgi:two-component system CheB/CheR fusion protein